jgi:hypothetical protein
VKDIRGFKVEAIRGPRDGQTGYVSCWPMPEWGINVAWDDGSLETVHDGDITCPDEAAQLARHAAVEARLRQLARMPKRDLLALVNQLARQRGASWILGGPRYWTRDELINGALELEFREATNA